MEDELSPVHEMSPDSSLTRPVIGQRELVLRVMPMPAEVAQRTQQKYLEAYAALTGDTLAF